MGMTLRHLAFVSCLALWAWVARVGLAQEAPAMGAEATAKEQDDTLCVLVLLPFGLQADTVAGGQPSRKELRLREIAMEHLHGLQVAAASLAQAGVSLHLHVADEVPDSVGRLHYGNLDVAQCDVVIGPLMRENVAVVAPKVDRFGREHVLLTDQPRHLVERGPGVRQAVPSEEQAAICLARHVAASHDTDRVVFLHTAGSEAAMEASFLATYNAAQRAKWFLPGDSMRYPVAREVVASTRSIGDVEAALSPYERNVVVSVAGRSARSMWAALQTALQMNDSSDIVLVGHPVVAELPFMEGELMNQWRVTLPQSGEVAWTDSLTRLGVTNYRLEVGTDPGKYALLAHDALVDAAARRHPWVRSAVHPLAHRFSWVQTEPNGAWHNADWTVCQFRELQWCPTDTLPALPPFVPRRFTDGEGEFLPVPFEYRHLFPEE